mmetsp:Transcript_7815/g.13791  ORF Transcript_7815/g.13791 Transcript_7815/m.13791 type:complete len:227 (-) Transcript_7815:24-704(-)
MYDSVLGKGRRTHEMVDGLSLVGESRLVIGLHYSSPGPLADRLTQVGPGMLAELAFFAARLVARDHVVTRFDGSDTWADGLYDPSSLMPEDAWEETFRVLATERVNISVAECIRGNLDAYLSFLRHCDLNLIDDKGLFGFEGQCSLARDDLADGVLGRGHKVRGGVRCHPCFSSLVLSCLTVSPGVSWCLCLLSLYALERGLRLFLQSFPKSREILAALDFPISRP